MSKTDSSSRHTRMLQNSHHTSTLKRSMLNASKTPHHGMPIQPANDLRLTTSPCTLVKMSAAQSTTAARKKWANQVIGKAALIVKRRSKRLINVWSTSVVDTHGWTKRSVRRCTNTCSSVSRRKPWNKNTTYCLRKKMMR